MADELLGYTATRQGTTVNRQREVRAEISWMHSEYDLLFGARSITTCIRTGSLKVERTDEDK